MKLFRVSRSYFYLAIAILAGVLIAYVTFYSTVKYVCAYNGHDKTCSPPSPGTSPVPDIVPTIIISPTIQPTIQPIITATPTPSSSGRSGGVGTIPNNPHTDTTEAPGSPTCTISFSPPALVSITAGQSGTLTINWLESSPVDKFSIIYGLVGQPMNWGEDNIPSTSRSLPINGLPIGSYINAQIWAWQNGCPQKSKILDPFVK